MATRKRNHISCPYCSSPNCSLSMSDFFPPKKIKYGSMMHNDKFKANDLELDKLDVMKKQMKSLEDSLLQSAIDSSINSFEHLLIEGLRRKGFEFADKHELETFVKSNCWCEDQTEFNRRIYYVNNVPFFLHYYSLDFNVTYENATMGAKFIIDMGKYIFL